MPNCESILSSISGKVWPGQLHSSVRLHRDIEQGMSCSFLVSTARYDNWGDCKVRGGFLRALRG